MVLCKGDNPLPANEHVLWGFEAATGRTLIPDSGGFSSPGVMLGDSPPELVSGGERLVFGAIATASEVAPFRRCHQSRLEYPLRRPAQALDRGQPSGFVMIKEFD